MKKSIQMAFLAVFTSVAVFASTPGKSVSVVEKTMNYGKYIQEHVFLPEQYKRSGFNKQVNITFSVDDSGKVTMVAAHTENASLRKIIEDQFMRLSFTGLTARVSNKVSLNFIVY